jgi:hypothetical protein
MESNMSRSTLKNVRLAGIADQGDLGSVVIRLMMVINDMTLVDDVLGLWTNEEDPSRKRRERGAKMYFVRLQISHVYEAMSIIQEISKNPALMKAVERARKSTKEAFAKLLAFIASAEYQKVMGRVRNNLTFHYAPGTIDKALQSLVAKNPEARGTLSLGENLIDWYFEPGDMVVDRAAVREIFKVPEGADVREETDKIIMRLHDIVQTCCKFAAGIIWENA